MRDFIRSEAFFRDQTFAFPRLRRLVKNWFARRYLHSLEQFDDYILSDIGLTRDDLRLGQSLPYDVDPIATLSTRREERMRRGIRRA